MKIEAGAKVTYLGRVKATIIGKRSRGWLIEYWGQGAREGELIRATVPAADLSAA
ncbi:hypothetical protein [Pseudomonas aeruginosa]|uniref:hypothetical protein n=1 Tax=Pseudomonas aeruginosa TaxID=287 RepID=UPI00141AE008|nr:hypothetical protein [Pseudomonas aeruginosa]EKU0488043.1 hypothetical protein [Pseudomonas aeruginosa]MCV4163021.1 hypothetical protein [Pseudomonas aeruginosa]MDP5513995.1 hypothetical protein [Pseudomonas aeruginosa]NQD29625.1 hypothetical protein [Pseudomonas aeruginosa]HCE6855207.1 hypothetical protein [Pseudomonas aeruginosa]